MCRSGNAPRTAFATADPEAYNRRSPPPPVSGARWFHLVSAHLNLPRPGRDKERAPRRGESKFWVEKSWAEKSWANSLGGKGLDEKHSDRHERSDSVADFAARDWHHHDPVCRTAGGGCGDSGAGLERRIVRLRGLANAHLSAGDLRA